jgi:hypothetical protein
LADVGGGAADYAVYLGDEGKLGMPLLLLGRVALSLIHA